MAISKQRLEELIEQGNAYIYDKYRGYSLRNREEKTGDFYWKRQVEVVDDCLHYVYEDGDNCENFDSYIKLEDLYETKEEVEWYREFGCIERTERLVLPTWEEVSRDLQNVPAGNYVIKEFDDVSLEYIKYRNGNYAVIGVYKYDDRLELEATKENYIKACRKAKELFLGDNNEI